MNFDKSIFVGVCNFKKDLSLDNESINLYSLRRLIMNVLQMHPFINAIEKYLLREYEGIRWRKNHYKEFQEILNQ